MPPRTRGERARLEEEGLPVSPAQSLPNEPRQKKPAAKKKKKSRRPPSSPPVEDTSEPQPQPTQEGTQDPTQDPTNDPPQDHTQESTTQPSEELLETKVTRRQTSKNTTSETQTQSKTYTTGETQTSTFPPYGLPQVPFPDPSEVDVQLRWNNPYLEGDERIQSLNLPAGVLPAMLSLITQHPEVAGTDRLHQLEQSLFYKLLMREHDNDRVQILTVIPGAKKRKREEGPTLESILAAKIQQDREDRDYLRNHPVPATDRQRQRQARIDETQNILQEVQDSRANEPRRKRTCTKLIPDLYDEEGNLRLGRYKKVEFELDDEPEIEPSHTDTHEQAFGNSLTENNLPQQHEPASTNDQAPPSTKRTVKASKLTKITEDPYNGLEMPYINAPLEETFPVEQLQSQTQAEPETPRTRGWSLSNIIPSSVSKFIPFSSRPTASPAAPSPTPAPSELKVLDEARTEQEEDRKFIREFSRAARKKKKRDTRNRNSMLGANFRSNPPTADFTPHHQVAKPGESHKSEEVLEQELRAEIEAEYKAKALAQSEKLTAALEKKVNEVNEHQQRVERDRMKIAQHLDEIIPGSKRKRMPSPEVIPNPLGASFGMDLDYFYISDADSDEQNETRVRRLKTKKARTSSQGAELIGGPTGNHEMPMETTMARTSSHEAGLVGGLTSNNPKLMRRARAEAREAELARASTDNREASFMSQVGAQTITTPSSNSYRNVFELSQSAQTTPEYAPNGPTMTFKVPSPTSSDDDSGLDLESPQGIAAPQSPSASKSSAPKQRPAPNYTATPTPSHLVEKARQKALMHQPKTGSSLRNASHLSPSTAASDPDATECDMIYEDFLTSHTSAYEEFMKGVSPKVAALMKATWTEADNKGAEKAFNGGLEGFMAV